MTGLDAGRCFGGNDAADGCGGQGRKTLSLFAGCGGMDLGFKQAGFKIIGANEWNKDQPAIAATYALNHAGTQLVDADITLPETKDRICRLFRGSRCNVIIGGPPCVADSTCGRRDADDPRGRLFHDYIDLVRRLRPVIVVMEKVIGALWKRKGETAPVVNRITSELMALGYRVDKQVLNAVDYGVPQNRRRVIIIATTLDVPIIFPDPTHSEQPDFFGTTRPWVTIGAAIDDLADMPEDEEWGHVFTQHTPAFLERVRRTPLNGHCGGRFRDGYRRIPPNVPSSIIKTVCWPLHYAKDRALTAREAARIQGFPDDFKFVGRKGDIATMIGNAVPPPLAMAVALSVTKMLAASDPEINGARAASTFQSPGNLP